MFMLSLKSCIICWFFFKLENKIEDCLFQLLCQPMHAITFYNIYYQPAITVQLIHYLLNVYVSHFKADNIFVRT